MLPWLQRHCTSLIEIHMTTTIPWNDSYHLTLCRLSCTFCTSTHSKYPEFCYFYGLQNHLCQNWDVFMDICSGTLIHGMLPIRWSKSVQDKWLKSCGASVTQKGHISELFGDVSTMWRNHSGISTIMCDVYLLCGGRKGIRPVKNWVVGCWRGYLSGARCRLAYGPANR